MNKIKRTYYSIDKSKLKPVYEAFDSKQDIKVTVNVETFNHEKYIRQCLDSILNQMVDFNVIINYHDDASTDSTREIVEEYRKKYPLIIFPIYQKENIYTKTQNFNDIFKIQGLRVKGNYVANCEGDDYWIDPYKLKTQVLLMDLFPNIHLCVHKVKKVNNNTGELMCLMPSFHMESKIISSSKFVPMILKKYSFQTSSYFYRSYDSISFYSSFPEFAKVLPVADDAMLMYFGNLGDTLYIDKEMSVYRKFAEGSWSINHRQYTDNKANRIAISRIKSLELYDDYTMRKYHKSCEDRINKIQISILLRNKQYDSLMANKKLKKLLRKRNPLLYLSIKYPALYNWLKRGKKSENN